MVLDWRDLSRRGAEKGYGQGSFMAPLAIRLMPFFIRDSLKLMRSDVVVERVRRTVWHAELAGQCCVVVDAAGVGAPVVERMHRAGLGCGFWAVTMTSGAQARPAGSMGGVARFTVPKVDLLSGVQTLLESGNLRIAPDLREAASLLRELRDMRMEVTGAGRARLGADGCGDWVWAWAAAELLVTGNVRHAEAQRKAE